jgi:Uma2 family endonuclease
VLPRVAEVKSRTFIAAAGMLLAIEVSDTTLPKDKGPKALRYAQEGVPELWVVDINARVTHVHRDPAAAGYARIDAIAFDQPLTPAFVAAPAIRITDIES